METAYPGDVIGLHNHGTITIGDTFTEGEMLSFNFQPCAGTVPPCASARSAEDEGAAEGPGAGLSEEGATQFFRPMSNDLILGGRCTAVRRGGVPAEGRIQRRSDVRQAERGHRALGALRRREEAGGVPRENAMNLAIDAAGELVYIAPTWVNLQLAQERWPQVRFSATREHAAAVDA